ncbi:MAG: metalloregulator ArsR/SmtB family transcription factor [archaeon]
MREKARFLKMLGDETKLRIIQCLLCGEVCACKLVPVAERAQPTVSAHLNDLERAGILESRRDGRNVYYKIRDARVFGLCKLMGIEKMDVVRGC